MARKKKDVEIEQAQAAIELAEKEKQESIEAEAQLVKEEAEAKDAKEAEVKAAKEAEAKTIKKVQAVKKLEEAKVTGDEKAISIATDLQNDAELELEDAIAKATLTKEAKAKELQEVIAARVKLVQEKNEAELAYDDIPLTARKPNAKQKEKRYLKDKVCEYKDESSIYGSQFYRI